MAGRLVGVRFRPPFGPKEGIEVVPPRRETPIRPGEPGFTGNPHTDFRIEPDPNLAVRDDLERRDFTVNAMARDIRTGAWIDPFGGQDDLAAGVLRAVHPSAFRDDPLRILRGVARARARRARPRARDAARSCERSRRGSPSCRPSGCARRSTRRLLGQWAADGLRLARDVGAFEAALPEWQACVGVPQRSSTQAYTVDEHILHVLDQAVQRDALARPAARGVLARRGQAARRRPAQPREGRRSSRRSRAAPPGIRQRHASRGRPPRARAPVRRGSRADAGERRDASSPASAARRRPTCMLLRRCDRLGRGVAAACRRTRRAGIASRSSSRPSGAAR